MRLRRHLSYANVAATAALLIAVAGGTTAIAGKSTAPKNSVTTKSIRPFNVTARDLTRLIEVRKQATVAPNARLTNIAACPVGSRLITGGGVVDSDGAAILGSQPTHEAWALTARGDSGASVTHTLTIAWCLSKKAQKPNP